MHTNRLLSTNGADDHIGLGSSDLPQWLAAHLEASSHHATNLDDWGVDHNGFHACVPEQFLRPSDTATELRQTRRQARGLSYAAGLATSAAINARSNAG